MLLHAMTIHSISVPIALGTLTLRWKANEEVVCVVGCIVDERLPPVAVVV